MIEVPHPDRPAMGVSVPKRLFKKAVDRNLIKRRIKEAYRLNKRDLYAFVEHSQIRLRLIIQYQQREIRGFHIIEKALKEGLAMLVHQLKE